MLKDYEEDRQATQTVETGNAKPRGGSSVIAADAGVHAGGEQPTRQRHEGVLSVQSGPGTCTCEAWHRRPRGTLRGGAAQRLALLPSRMATEENANVAPREHLVAEVVETGAPAQASHGP